QGRSRKSGGPEDTCGTRDREFRNSWVHMHYTVTEAFSSELLIAIQLLAECKLVLLHGGELQSCMSGKFKSIDAQLHKTTDCRLSQATRASAQKGRVGQCLLADRTIAQMPCC